MALTRLTPTMPPPPPLLILLAQRLLLLQAITPCAEAGGVPAAVVPRFRLFEASVSNPRCTAENKFSGVALNTSFIAPSGRTATFWGFYDGGTTWRWRFMPDEPGEWRYSWSFSDGSGNGTGRFLCVSAGASPGVVGAYRQNPRWFAYNGVTPVHLKSFYNKAGGLIRQNVSWAAEHYYDKFIGKGYNHHMSSGLLPILELTQLGDGQPFADGPPAINSTIYTDKKDPAGSMQLDVWRSLEAHLSYLNDRDVIADFFQGFDGGKHVQWGALASDAKRWWVSYMLARLAPFANIGGFVYKWETSGDDPHGDAELADLLRELDPFSHLRTYEAENVTESNQFGREQWGFASVEALGASCVPKRGHPGEECHPYLTEAGASTQNHHDVSLQGFVGKPVYMAEGHDLWRSWWMAEEPNVVRAAWAVTTAGASWTWADIGHAEDDPYLSSQGLTTYPSASKSVDVLHEIMTEVLPAFYRMEPLDELLQEPAPSLTFCLAEPGLQYIVYSDSGAPFRLNATTATVSDAAVSYNLTWFDAVTGAARSGGPLDAGIVRLVPPTRATHWVAVLLAPTREVLAPSETGDASGLEMARGLSAGVPPRDAAAASGWMRSVASHT